MNYFVNIFVFNTTESNEIQVCTCVCVYVCVCMFACSCFFVAYKFLYSETAAAFAYNNSLLSIIPFSIRQVPSWDRNNYEREQLTAEFYSVLIRVHLSLG